MFNIIKVIVIIILLILLNTAGPFVSNSLAEGGLDVDVIGAVSTGYDDNVSSSNGNTVSDSVSKVSAGLSAGTRAKTSDFSLRGSVTQNIYASHSSFNNTSENFTSEFNKDLTKYDRFSVKDDFVNADEPGSFSDSFGGTSGRYSYNRNRFYSEYEKELSRQVSVHGYYDNDYYTASRDDISDSLIQSAGFDASYAKSAVLSFLSGYDFTMQRLYPGDAATVHTVRGGGKYSLTNDLSVETQAGVSFVDAHSGSKTSSPSVAVSFKYDITDRESAGITYLKQSSPNTTTADIFDSWRVTANWNKRLLSRLRAALSAFVGKGEYDNLNISDRQTGGSARFDYDLREAAAAFVRYTYTDVDSDPDSRGYRRNVVESGVRIIF